ncbi:arsenate reductase (glutaredoxin) [Photobacterium leiognathi]|uniref:arsenate reductase (glutaredoxin) n=1 Tax=Photobacterium leiognathi TaxID=553611 RepID=UPI0029815B24|nr:arsenate reductase (glutaredoxin) [Photobacterium leiognathi]
MVVIHHNPECGTSRNVLQIIQDAGYEPVVIEYIQEGWTKPQLQALFAAANLTPRTALRTSKSPAKELGLLDASVSDDVILEAMLEHPVLVNRPIVCTAKGVKLCRPSEAVLDVLENWPKGPLIKEDGEVIIDENGNRLL